jgi:hypothetical protein
LPAVQRQDKDVVCERNFDTVSSSGTCRPDQPRSTAVTIQVLSTLQRFIVKNRFRSNFFIKQAQPSKKILIFKN